MESLEETLKYSLVAIAKPSIFNILTCFLNIYILRVYKDARSISLCEVTGLQ